MEWVLLREFSKTEPGGTLLVVQWLRFHTPNAGGPGLIPGQGIRSHMPQLKIPHAATKIPHVATKICTWQGRSHMPQQRPSAAK